MRTQRSDVTCIGELIIDLVAKKPSSLADAEEFQKHAGGASANVAVGLARLGARSAFVGKVGDDPFGGFLKRELQSARVNTTGLIMDPNHKTRLAFISLKGDGERDFEFWERLPADEQLGARDVSMKQLAAAKIVHISSFLLLHEPSRSTALNIAAALHRRGVMVSFDPNIRLSLWRSLDDMRDEMRRMLRYTTILRLNLDEACQVTGARTGESAAQRLLAMGPSLVVITRGRNGCLAFTDKISIASKGFSVDACDTTGCGDAFLAGLLYGIIRAKQPVEGMDESSLSRICRFANATGAITSTRYGVIPALPRLSEVRKLMKERE